MDKAEKIESLKNVSASKDFSKFLAITSDMAMDLSKDKEIISIIYGGQTVKITESHGIILTPILDKSVKHYAKNGVLIASTEEKKQSNYYYRKIYKELYLLQDNSLMLSSITIPSYWEEYDKIAKQHEIVNDYSSLLKIFVFEDIIKETQKHIMRAI